MVLTLLLLPPWLVEWRHLPLSAKERLDAENDIRSSLIQVLGGAVVVTGLYFTARGFRLTREGHITDRYSRAIEHVGSTNADVRIGGIYALERIARDSVADRDVVYEVLTTFIREHTRTAPQEPSDERVGADVQAALNVLARRPPTARGRSLDLYMSGLNGADFRAGDFRGASLYYSRLDGAIFTGSNIDGAGLSFCKAKGAGFNHCSAQGASFVNAEYTGCWFIASDFTDADFFGCDLSGSDFGRRRPRDDPGARATILAGARFTNAVLKGTNLRGVNLSDVSGLTREQVNEAITDDETRLPDIWSRNDDEPDPRSD